MRQLMQTQHAFLPTMDKNNNINNYGNHDKKKRLTSDQLESLEKSFQGEIKLDPDRKAKLLERLYDALKQEYNAVSRGKQQLQEEVLALRAILKKQLTKKASLHQLHRSFQR